jgi:hypothetical protein
VVTLIQPGVQSHLDVDQVVGRPRLLHHLHPLLRNAEVLTDDGGEGGSVVGPSSTHNAPSSTPGQFADI